MTPKDRVTVLRLKRTRHKVPTWRWDPVKQLWAGAEVLAKTNLFSKVGIGVGTVVFTLYPTDFITLHDALLWQGCHHFITSIIRESPTRMVVTTAKIGTTACTATWLPKAETKVLDEYGSAIRPDPVQMVFPACVTEKWIGYAQQTPQAVLDITLVLVTPKAVQLPVGALVSVGELGTYTVQVPHLLDTHKNEYEVGTKKEG